MNRTALSLLLSSIIVLHSSFIVCSDPVSPASVSLISLTDAASIEFASDAEFYQGDTLSLTNSVMYSGPTVTNTALQNLDGCTITGSAGSGTNIVTFTGSVISTNAGTWTASFTIPPVNPCYIEVAVSNGAIRTYEQQKIKTKPHLGQ